MQQRPKYSDSQLPVPNDKRIVLGSTHEAPTDATRGYLEFHLGFVFRDKVSENSWLLGQATLLGSGHDLVCLLATRYLGRRPGLDIEIAWDSTYPGANLIMDYYDKVRTLLPLAP